MTLAPDSRRLRGACALDCPATRSWIVALKDAEAVTLRGDERV